MFNYLFKYDNDNEYNYKGYIPKCMLFSDYIVLVEKSPEEVNSGLKE